MLHQLWLFYVQDGETLLHVALNHGHLKVFILLLGSLTDVDVNAQDKVDEWKVVKPHQAVCDPQGQYKGVVYTCTYLNFYTMYSGDRKFACISFYRKGEHYFMQHAWLLHTTLQHSYVAMHLCMIFSRVTLRSPGTSQDRNYDIVIFGLTRSLWKKMTTNYKLLYSCSVKHICL